MKAIALICARRTAQTPSPPGASADLYDLVQLAMLSSTLDDAIMERIAFLQEQIHPNNNPRVNETFRHQIAILQTADLVKLEASIAIRRAHLKRTGDTQETDRLFCELEALEWLQRQVKRQV